MNKPSVFISSTIREMADLRNKVRNLLENSLGYDVLLSENEGSKPKTPFEQCKKWAKECDIFVAILGNDYGWIIPELGISVCEYEFNEAYKENPEKILIYVSHTEKDDKQKRFVDRITNFKDGYYRRPPFNNETELLNGIRDDIAEYFKGILGIVRSKKLKIKSSITPSKEDYAIYNRSNRIKAMMDDVISLTTDLGFEQVKYSQPIFWLATKNIRRRKILFTFIVIPNNLDDSWMREINIRHSEEIRYDTLYEKYPNRFTIVFVHGSANLSTLEKQTRYFSGTCFKVEPGLYFGADLTGDSKPQGKMTHENRIVVSKVENRQELSNKLSDALQWINQEYSRINFKSNYRKRLWLKNKTR